MSGCHCARKVIARSYVSMDIDWFLRAREGAVPHMSQQLQAERMSVERQTVRFSPLGEKNQEAMEKRAMKMMLITRLQLRCAWSVSCAMCWPLFPYPFAIVVVLGVGGGTGCSCPGCSQAAAAFAG